MLKINVKSAVVKTRCALKWKDKCLTHSFITEFEFLEYEFSLKLQRLG